MVQDLTTSFDQFETFAVSEMAKKPEKDDNFTPFTPKFWSNRYSTNSMTSYFEGNSQDLFSTPRRSGRIANQTKIDYNENIPKRGNYSQKPRHKSPKRCYANLKKRSSNTDRIKAIKTLFRKPNGGDIAKKKQKSENRKNNSSKKRVKEGKMPNKLCISIPLHKIQTRLLTKSVTKASLKLFENVLTTTKYQKQTNEEREQHSTSTTIIEASYANKIPTENEFDNVSEKSFSDIFKSFVDSSKENKKLKYNSTAKSFIEREIMQSAGTIFRKFSENNDNIPNISQKLEENIVKEAFEGRQQYPDNFMEVSDETQNPLNLEARNEDSQMMEISNGSQQYLEEELPKDAVHFSAEDNEVLKKNHESDRSIIKEASAEKEQPLDLTFVDASDKRWKPRKIDVRNQSINTEENNQFIEDLTIMEVSNEIPSSKRTIPNDTRNCSPDNVSFFDLLKKNEQPKQNFNTERQPCMEESVKIQTLTISKVRNDKQIKATTQALSIMRISDKIQKPENMNKKAFAEKDDLTIIEVSEELQNPTRIDIRNDTPAFEDNDDDDVFIVQNKPLRLNYKTGVFEKCPSQSSYSTILDENENDYQDDERASKERKIIQELKSLIEECPLDGSEKSFDENLTETSNNFDENPAETIVNEVEIYEESNDSEIVIIEEPFLDNSENLDEEKNVEGFNKSSDDVEMHFPQGHHPFYQQEYIELVHQYNYFPFPNYQYPRYEYPIEENKFDHRPNNLSFLAQRYGEFQIPQIHLDYNNYRMQFHAHGNLEEDDKLKITEYYDSEEEENEKELDTDTDTDQNEPQNKTLQVQPRSNLDQKQLPILSQPPPIQCSSEQHYHPSMHNIINPQTTQMHLQSQSQIGHICENSLHLQGYSQNNSDLTNNNNRWQIVSIQNSGQTSYEQRDSQLYENTCSIHVYPHINDENQSESLIVQRLHQVPTQNIHPQQSQTEIIERQHQVMPLDNLQQGHQPLSQIADFVKNNCYIHDVKFGKIKILNGRMYRTGSLLITFGDHYEVQVIGDLILNNINENIAFDAFFSPRNQF